MNEYLKLFSNLKGAGLDDEDWSFLKKLSAQHAGGTGGGYLTGQYFNNLALPFIDSYVGGLDDQNKLFAQCLTAQLYAGWGASPVQNEILNTIDSDFSMDRFQTTAVSRQIIAKSVLQYEVKTFANKTFGNQPNGMKSKIGKMACVILGMLTNMAVDNAFHDQTVIGNNHFELDNPIGFHTLYEDSMKIKNLEPINHEIDYMKNYAEKFLESDKLVNLCGELSDQYIDGMNFQIKQEKNANSINEVRSASEQLQQSKPKSFVESLQMAAGAETEDREPQSKLKSFADSISEENNEKHKAAHSK